MSALLGGIGEALALTEHDAHVWLLETDTAFSESTLRACMNVLSAPERRRCERFVGDAPRRQFMLAHALLRGVLSRYSSVKPAAWRFDVADGGRPEIARGQDAAPLRFNLSHTPGLCACVVTRRADCGIDVERRGRVDAPVTVAEKILAPAELRELHALPAQARRGFFERAWVLKEAYLKARGCGLRLEPTSFGLHAGLDEKITFAPPADDRARDWQFRLAEPTPRHRLALALRRQSSGCFEIATLVLQS